MAKRSSLIILLILALALSWSGIQRAASQQDEERKQFLSIGYPNPAIIIDGNGKRYGGIIYVSVYPVSPNLVTKYGPGPMMTAELTPSQRDLRQYPLGKYEVRYGMRTGSELKTFIVRDVILRADGGTQLIVEMNADAKTTVIGGDMTAQQMEEYIHHLLKDVAELRQDVTRLQQK